MEKPSDDKLLAQAFERFRKLLEDGHLEIREHRERGDSPRAAVWEVKTSNASADLTVRAYSRFAPRHVDQLVGGIPRLIRGTAEPAILVTAPWLSARSRQLLAERKINYLDLTGNVRIRVPRLPIVVYTDGAGTDPFPSDRPRRGLRGRSVNGLVRALVDHAPPYRMTDLAHVAGLSLAYVSRTVEALDEERLLHRSANRTIVDVDWPRLLRARAEQYSLIKSNHGHGYIARTGLSVLTRALGSARELADPSAENDKLLVTGSYAVREYVKVAAPAQLALYVADTEKFAEEHQLMPTDRGANVLLLQAAHPSQLERARLVGATSHAGPSQLVLDCLGGNGRLPEEGEALIQWMQEHPEQWRHYHLSRD